MKLPLAPSGISTMAAIWDWLRALSTAIARGWNVEHKSDGTHDWDATDMTYDAGRFTASSSTWGVDSADVTSYVYAVLGNVMVLSFRILSTDVGAGNGYLALALPSGYRATEYAYGHLIYSDAGAAYDVGTIEATPGDRFVKLYTRTLANWTNTTGDNTHVQGTITMVVTKD